METAAPAVSVRFWADIYSDAVLADAAAVVLAAASAEEEAPLAGAAHSAAEAARADFDVIGDGSLPSPIILVVLFLFFLLSQYAYTKQG